MTCWLCKKEFIPIAQEYHAIENKLGNDKKICHECYEVFRQLIKDIFNDFMTDY